jgi:hypothetical protein
MESSEKLKKLVEYYGKLKGYPEKSYLKMFTDDHDLNYNQWNAYTRGAQVVGSKIVQTLMDIFPSLNMNWYLKEDYNMFTDEKLHEVAEIDPKYAPEIVDQLYVRVEALSKTLKEINKLSDLKK